MMKTMGLFFGLVLICSHSVFAKSASETATSYYNILKKKDYQGAAEFFDAQSLKQFRDTMGFVDEIPDPVQQMFFTRFFGPGESKETVAKLTDAGFVAAFIRAVMAQAEIAGGLSFENLEILGEVKEGEKIVHVLTRNKVKAGEIELEALEVISLTKSGDGWKVLLSAKMKGLAQQLKASLRKQSNAQTGVNK